MAEAVTGVTQFALNKLAARRIEARCDPANEKGIAVVQRAGYILEKSVFDESPHHFRREPTDISVLVHLT